MTLEQRKEITKISKEFAKPFIETICPINGSGWLIVDPLSGYLNLCGYEHILELIPEKDDHPIVLILTFKDGSKFIPAGEDLKYTFKDFQNWQWI